MQYTQKFDRIKTQTLFHKLDPAEQDYVRRIAADNFMTQQELKKVVESCIDLNMWEEKGLVTCWDEWRQDSTLQGREFKKWAMARLEAYMHSRKAGITRYAANPPRQSAYRPVKIRLDTDTGGQKIFGMCPVKSEKTLCCNLRTIDAVKNCGFGCSYCSIQTMYTDQNIVFDKHFREKLDAINLDPDRYYHIGTGQSSDALMWGNKHNILEDMFWFARKWPRALVEFKTKSRNISYLLETEVPGNVVCSWSLNPDTVINNEEHHTASLEQRIGAARAVADKNIRVAFHLHPMLHFQGWEQEYARLVDRIMASFSADEIVFISFGALTFPRPIIGKIRSYGIHSKISQTEMVANPEGKLTYPENIKVALFSHVYNRFTAWHDRVFFYLCMEDPVFWDRAFGWRFADNETMEARLLESAWSKLPAEMD